MVFEYINFEILLKYTNILVILYAIVYAARFIYITKDDTARKPWEYLTYAIIVLFLIQVIVFLNVPFYEIIQEVLTLILATMLLLVFIFQNTEMGKKNYETVTRKNFIPVNKEE